MNSSCKYTSQCQLTELIDKIRIQVCKTKRTTALLLYRSSTLCTQNNAVSILSCLWFSINGVNFCCLFGLQWRGITTEHCYVPERLLQYQSSRCLCICHIYSLLIFLPEHWMSPAIRTCMWRNNRQTNKNRNPFLVIWMHCFHLILSVSDKTHVCSQMSTHSLSNIGAQHLSSFL